MSRRFGVRSCGVCLAIAIGATTSSAHAELSNEARADQLFRSAQKKFDGGDYGGACTDFSESLKLGPKLGTLLNLALCHETVGKVVTAWREYSHGAVWAAQNNQRDRLEFATQHIRALEPKLPRIVVQLPADRAIDGLELDGEPLPEARWALPLYLDPGEHRLAITAPGKRRTTVAFRVAVAPTDQLVYIPPLADDTGGPPAKAGAVASTEEKMPPRRLAGWIGVGAGAVSVAVGATFGVLAVSAEERDPAVHGRATVATAAVIGGAVLAGVGGYLVWSTPRRRTLLAVSPRPEGGVFSLATSF